MVTLIVIVILLACVALGFFILIQNPKGGGLSGSFGSMSSQVMGVKQSSDIMEKGTWTLIGVIAGLCIVCLAFFPKSQGDSSGKQQIQKNAPAKKK